MSGIRFSNFPRTQAAPSFLPEIIEVFRKHEPSISTLELTKGLTSDAALAIVRDSLRELGFDVEGGKRAAAKIKRPVFFGENGKPDLQYEIDAYHRDWRCGLEIEAGRGWMGNAVYRDIVQALVMVDLRSPRLGCLQRLPLPERWARHGEQGLREHDSCR